MGFDTVGRREPDHHRRPSLRSLLARPADPRLSDADRSIGEAYGAKKGADEDWPDFPRRVSILIDPDGNVARTYTVKDVAAHPGEVLADITAATG